MSQRTGHINQTQECGLSCFACNALGCMAKLHRHNVLHILQRTVLEFAEPSRMLSEICLECDCYSQHLFCLLDA